jgi:hypothetical protein
VRRCHGPVEDIVPFVALEFPEASVKTSLRMSNQAGELCRYPERFQVHPLSTQLSDQCWKRLIAKDLSEVLVLFQHGIILLQCGGARLPHLALP